MRFRKCLFVGMIFCLIPLGAMADEIIVAGAANLQFTLEEIKAVFEKETGITVKTIIGSSGKLTTQIENEIEFRYCDRVAFDEAVSVSRALYLLSDRGEYAEKLPLQRTCRRSCAHE